jgi:hypothetical protein
LNLAPSQTVRSKNVLHPAILSNHGTLMYVCVLAHIHVNVHILVSVFVHVHVHVHVNVAGTLTQTWT